MSTLSTSWCAAPLEKSTNHPLGVPHGACEDVQNFCAGRSGNVVLIVGPGFASVKSTTDISSASVGKRHGPLLCSFSSQYLAASDWGTVRLSTKPSQVSFVTLSVTV
jgi:hypothetical protein